MSVIKTRLYMTYKFISSQARINYLQFWTHLTLKNDLWLKSISYQLIFENKLLSIFYRNLWNFFTAKKTYNWVHFCLDSLYSSFWCKETQKQCFELLNIWQNYNDFQMKCIINLMKWNALKKWIPFSINLFSSLVR